MHAKMKLFLNQPWQQMRASLILLFGKTKALFGKDATRKKLWFLHMLFVENERETSKLKYGGTFFYEVEGHMQKLSSFGRGKNYGLKSHFRFLCIRPFKYKAPFSGSCWVTLIYRVIAIYRAVFYRFDCIIWLAAHAVLWMPPAGQDGAILPTQDNCPLTVSHYSQ